MEYRRRLIALHQDERGYSPQGKRGSGLVSIEVKGDTAFVSVTARDLIRPQNGTYIAVLFPCNAQTMPYVLGEIDYNERSMQLHKSIITSNMPYDIDDYRAAAIIFVGIHINFVLVGQSGCNLDWMRVKSNLRLKGPGCLIPQPHRRRGVNRSTISTYEEPAQETGSEETAQAKDPSTNKDMPLKDYGKIHFVDNSGTSSVGSVSASAPYVVSDFDKEKPFEEVNAAKAEALEENSEDVFEAKGFDYSELTEEAEKVNAPLEVSLAEEDDVVASVHYDKGIEHSDLKAEPESKTTETSSKLTPQDEHELDHTELTDASADAVETSATLTINEENELKIRSKAEEIKTFSAKESEDTAAASIETEASDEYEQAAIEPDSEEASSSNVLSDEIEDARGFDYSELLGGAEDKKVSADAQKASVKEAEETFEEESFEDDEASSLNEIETVSGSSIKPTDEEIEKSFEEIEETISEDDIETSDDKEHSYMSSMTDEEYLKALDPYGGEPTEKTSATMHEDIDPCIYSQREVRKKMITCKKYGKRLPVRPFPAMTNSKWYKIEYPGMGSSFHYLIGSIHDDKGQEQVRCTAVPGPYGINPPAGLTGFTHYMTAQGLGNAGYWISFVNPKTGRPMDVL